MDGEEHQIDGDEVNNHENKLNEKKVWLSFNPFFRYYR